MTNISTAAMIVRPLLKPTERLEEEIRSPLGLQRSSEGNEGIATSRVILKLI